MVCKRHKVESYKTPSAPLPKNSFQAAAVFQVTGGDGAEPLILNTGKKFWIILITCAVYRAINLDVNVHREFYDGIENIYSPTREGTYYLSGNGSNFVDVENLPASITWDEVKRYSDIHIIKWIFNSTSGVGGEAGGRASSSP